MPDYRLTQHTTPIVVGTADKCSENLDTSFSGLAWHQITASWLNETPATYGPTGNDCLTIDSCSRGMAGEYDTGKDRMVSFLKNEYIEDKLIPTLPSIDMSDSLCAGSRARMWTIYLGPPSLMDNFQSTYVCRILLHQNTFGLLLEEAVHPPFMFFSTSANTIYYT